MREGAGMERKVVEKKRNARPVQTTAAKRIRKYLSPKFTRQLVEHMHQAKMAALECKE